MSAYVLFVMLLIGDEFQVASYPNFEACDAAAIKMLQENQDIFAVRCVLDEQAK